MRVVAGFRRLIVLLRRSIVGFFLRVELSSMREELRDMRDRLQEAQSAAETADMEKEMLAKVVERMRVHYETDIAIQARIAAQGGATGERSMG